MYDPQLLRAFVAVVESGGFTRAAQALHLTQSTVSQQLRRLEDEAGQLLLDRSERRVRTTQAGERLLGYARRLLALGAEARAAMAQAAPLELIRLGVPEDLAGALLTPVLSAFARQREGLRLSVTSGMSADLIAGYERGDYDVILAKQRRAEGLRSWPEQAVWVDSRQHPCLQRDPLPLAVFPDGGLYREEMFEALDARRLRWHIGYCSSSLASLQAAVADGLGISLLPQRALRAGHRVLGEADGLPARHPMRLALHHPAGASATTLALVQQLARRCEEIAAPPD